MIVYVFLSLFFSSYGWIFVGRHFIPYGCVSVRAPMLCVAHRWGGNRHVGYLLVGDDW